MFQIESTFKSIIHSEPPSYLHLVHGLAELLELVGGGQGLETDVRQFHVLVPQLFPQLHHRHAVRTLRQPADTGRTELDLALLSTKFHTV